MLKQIILLVVTILLLSSCQEKKQTTASLHGKYTGFDKPITLYVRNHGEEISFGTPIFIDTIVTSADGSFSVSLDASTPKELLLEGTAPDGSNKIYQTVFIEAGDSIYYESEGKLQSPLKNLKGTGSNKLAVIEKAKIMIGRLSLHQIIAKKDSALILTELNNRLKKYDALTDSINSLFSTDFVNFVQGSKLQETAYFLKVLPSYLQAYGFPSFAIDSVVRNRAYEAIYSFSPHGYKNFNFAEQLHQLLLSKLSKTDTVTEKIKSYVTLVDSLHLPDEGNQLMTGKIILHFLEQGKAKEIEPILTNFYTRYPASAYTETLKAQFAEWNALSPGMPAPDFSATQLDGNAFRLSDLKGKVVYLDIWAVWCGPCRAEIPFAEKIKSHYAKTNDIVFLNVSVDSQKEIWKEFLDKNPDFKGLHVNDPGDFDAEIAKIYKVGGIPKYMVIDRAGKIFSTDAYRPSDGEKLTKQLDDALGLHANSTL